MDYKHLLLLMNQQVTKKVIKDLEKKYRDHMIDWQKDDTMYTYFKRAGFDTLAEEFKKDYKRLGLIYESSSDRA